MLETQPGSYDPVAEKYAGHFHNEMDNKPFDRKMLDWLIEKVGDTGIICDMGCGPGQIARYVHSRGATVCGIDLSTEMVRHARALNPGISFQPGDMLALTSIADDSYGGIAAFYSIVNLPRKLVPCALQELCRVLRPNGVLLLAFHLGQKIEHVQEMLGAKVSLDFYYFETGEVRLYLDTAGFTVEEAIERDPYPQPVEYQSRRAYIFARKPPGFSAQA